MANLVEMHISELKKDPNQPRTYIDSEKVKNMALSMRTEGVINPIEIDMDNVIITGEMRWRAAKEAGLTTVPCIQRDIDNETRYRRQLIENLHNGTMNAIDTAVALKKLLGIGDSDSARLALAKEIGIDPSFIQEHMDILRTSAEIQAKIRDRVIPRTITRAINLVPDEYKWKFQEKILEENLSRDTAVSIARSMHFNYELAEEILRIDFRGVTSFEALKKLERVAPSASQRIERDNSAEKELHKHVQAIVEWMSENNMDDVSNIHRELIKSDFRLLSKSVSAWASEQKQLGEGKN